MKWTLIAYPSAPGPKEIIPSSWVEWWNKKHFDNWFFTLQYYARKKLMDIAINRLYKCKTDSEFVKKHVKEANKLGLTFIPITGHTKVPRRLILVKTETGMMWM